MQQYPLNRGLKRKFPKLQAEVTSACLKTDKFLQQETELSLVSVESFPKTKTIMSLKTTQMLSFKILAISCFFFFLTGCLINEEEEEKLKRQAKDFANSVHHVEHEDIQSARPKLKIYLNENYQEVIVPFFSEDEEGALYFRDSDYYAMLECQNNETDPECKNFQLFLKNRDNDASIEINQAAQSFTNAPQIEQIDESEIRETKLVSRVLFEDLQNDPTAELSKGYILRQRCMQKSAYVSLVEMHLTDWSIFFRGEGFRDPDPEEEEGYTKRIVFIAPSKGSSSNDIKGSRSFYNHSESHLEGTHAIHLKGRVSYLDPELQEIVIDFSDSTVKSKIQKLTVKLPSEED